MPENQENPKPKVNEERLAELEEELLNKVEKRAEAKKLEDQANAEIEAIQKESVSVGGNVEQVLLFIASALLLFSLPFIHILLASVLAIFTVVISLIAGLTSRKNPVSPVLNLIVSLLGLIVFEYSAIVSHADSSSRFGFYELIAFIFLLSTFFSMRTYQKRNAE